MGMFDNAVDAGVCPACGQMTRQTMRWFHDTKAALDTGAVGQMAAQRDRQAGDQAGNGAEQQRVKASGDDAHGDVAPAWEGDVKI